MCSMYIYRNIMEDSKQRNSPDSSTHEDTKPSMTNNNHLSGGAASHGEVSTRSSKNLTLGYKCPKGCKTIFVDESTFAGHLLSEHNVKLVVTAPQENQQLVEGSQITTTPSPLSSLSSPSSTPPIMSSSAAAVTVITKCPVCRLQVDDLPYHFATAHSTTNKSQTNHDRSESTTNNNVLINRRGYIGNLTNRHEHVNQSNNDKWTSSQPNQPLVVVHTDAIKSEVLSFEEMECGMEADHVPQKPESPIKITNSASSRKNNPPARVMPIFLPNQPLPASQLAIEECSSMASQRGSIGGEHSPTLKNFERHVRNLPMTVIPTVLGNSRLGSQVASSITMNGQANSPEHDSGIHLNQIMA